MPLETGTQIGDLDPANPPGTDLLAESDDHIRLLKLCVKGSLGDMPALWTIATNDTPIRQANAAASGFIDMIKVNTDDEVEIGETGGSVLVNGKFLVSDLVANLSNDQFLTGSNVAADGFINIIKVNLNDEIEFGAVPLVVPLGHIAFKAPVSLPGDAPAGGGFVQPDVSSGLVIYGKGTSFDTSLGASGGLVALGIVTGTRDVLLPLGSLTTASGNIVLINTDPEFSIQNKLDGELSVIRFKNSAGNSRAGIVSVVSGVTSTLALQTGVAVDALTIDNTQNVTIPTGNLTLPGGALTVSAGADGHVIEGGNVGANVLTIRREGTANEMVFKFGGNNPEITFSRASETLSIFQDTVTSKFLRNGVEFLTSDINQNVAAPNGNFEAAGDITAFA